MYLSVLFGYGILSVIRLNFTIVILSIMKYSISVKHVYMYHTFIYHMSSERLKNKIYNKLFECEKIWFWGGIHVQLYALLEMKIHEEKPTSVIDLNL